MARARNIKPGFFKNEHLVELPFETRLLFAGLWTLADREGRLEDRPKKIKMEIFPADDVDVNEALQQLHEVGMIIRYVVENKGYIEVVKFVKHQNPHVKESISVIPAPDSHGACTIQATPLTSSLIPDSPIPQTGTFGGRRGISRTMIPLNADLDLELETWLGAVAVAVGAKSARGIPKRDKWEKVCMAAIQEQRDLGRLLKIIEAEKQRLGDEVQYFSPEGCLQKLQMNGGGMKKFTH